MALAAVLVAAVVAACGNGQDDQLVIPYTGPHLGDGASAALGDDGINRTGVGAGTGAATGLPCDVQQLLENRCIGCHLDRPSPPSLLTYDDLMKPSVANASKNLASASLDRMKATTAPMPPAPAELPTAAEIATMEAWIAAGTPRGLACTPVAGSAAPSNQYNTPVVCTSNARSKDSESASMSPGGACVTCHSRRGGPSFKLAGTVYPSAHEPDDCNGVAGGVKVVVTDANNVVTEMTANGVGNFSSKAKITPPFKVKVVNGTKERVMLGALTAGDCNSCHTEAGVNGAPGRVMAP